MNPMKRILITCLLLIAVCVKPAMATHFVGSDMAYTCVPGQPGFWKITFTIYRDCGSGEGSTAALCPGGCGSACAWTLNVTGADPSCNGSSFGTMNCSLVSVSDVNINAQCPTAKSVCGNMNCKLPGTYTPGVEKYVFEGTVNLGPTSAIPASCCNVRISYGSCCRNSAITTISNPASAGYYTELVINRCVSVNPCNSSPVFANEPFITACQGQPYIYSNGSADPDHDSLSYALVPALQDVSTPVTYIAPYSATAPLPYAPPVNAPFPLGFNNNPLTGDVMFTPSYTGSGPLVGVMAVEVKQWKTVNGTPMVIGTTRRDIQVWLLNCPPDNTPTIKTAPVNQSSWEVCAGSTLCFDVIAKDTDYNPPTVSDTTFLSWDATLAQYGATFTPKYNPANRKLNGPREDIYQFCWTPSESIATNVPWYFSVNAKDNRCPNPGKLIQSFSVKVLPKPDVTIQKTSKGCGNWQLSYIANPLKPSQQFTSTTWAISQVPNDYTGTQVVTYNTATPPVQHFTLGGKYLVSLTLQSAGPQGGSPCSKTFYDTLVVDTQVTVNVHDTFACKGSNLTFRYKARYGTPPYTYRWFPGNDTNAVPLNTPNFTDTSFTIIVSTSQTYTLQVRDLAGCRFGIPVKVFSPAVSAGHLQPVCSNDESFDLTTTAGATTNSAAPGFWTYEPVSPLNGINLALADSQHFDPSRVSITSAQATWKLYYNDHSTACEAKDSIQITVAKAPAVAVTFAQNAQKTLSVAINTGSYTLNSTSAPAGGTSNFFSIPPTAAFAANPSNPMQAVFNTSYPALSPATYDLVHLYSLPVGSIQCVGSDTAHIEVKLNTGMQHANGFDRFNLYPNPTNGLLNLEFSTDEKLIQVQVVDVLGRVVKNLAYPHTAGDFKATLDLSACKAGVYFLDIQAGSRHMQNRVTIK